MRLLTRVYGSEKNYYKYNFPGIAPLNEHVVICRITTCAVISRVTFLEAGYKRGWPGRKILDMHTNMANKFKRRPQCAHTRRQ